MIECEWRGTDGQPAPAEFPDMIWATNYSRLACQTLFTLWSAGRDYAPKCIIDGVNIQDYLQEHYFAAISKLGEAIRDAGDLFDDCVIGWDSLNEPNAGYLGIENLAQHGKESVLRIGPTPTPFQAMRLGMGQRVEVENWRVGSLGSKRDGSVVVDPEGVRAWLAADAEEDGSLYGWTRGPDWELGTCIWSLHGVWDPDTDELLQPDYFALYRGPVEKVLRKVDFGADYWLQHWRRYAPVVRKFHAEAILFVATPVFQVPPKIDGPELQQRVVHSTHFYDGLTLVTKHWVSHWSPSRNCHPLLILYIVTELVQRGRSWYSAWELRVGHFGRESWRIRYPKVSKRAARNASPGHLRLDGSVSHDDRGNWDPI